MPFAACTRAWFSECKRQAHEHVQPREKSILPSLEGWHFTPEGAAVFVGQETAVIADVHLGYEWARGSSRRLRTRTFV